MISADSSYILSKNEQEQIVRRLSDMAEKAFVDEADFCNKEDLMPGSVGILLSRYLKSLKVSELFKFQTTVSNKSYLVSQPLRLKLQREINNKVAAIEERWKVGPSTEEIEHRFQLGAFPGLELKEALQFCQDTKETNLGIEGIFKAEEDSIYYTPKAYLIFQREQKLRRFQNGDVSFLNLEDFVGQLPSQFEKIQEALDYASEQQSNTKLSSQSHLPYIISDAWVKSQADLVTKTVETDNSMNIAVCTINSPLFLQGCLINSGSLCLTAKCLENRCI